MSPYMPLKKISYGPIRLNITKRMNWHLNDRFRYYSKENLACSAKSQYPHSGKPSWHHGGGKAA